MLLLAVIVEVIALGIQAAVVVLLFKLSTAVLHIIGRLEQPESGAGVAKLQAEVDGLTVAVAEGIERTARSERRVKSTIKRAKDRLVRAGVYDDGIEAEEAGLRGDDEDRSEEIGVPHLPDPLGELEDSRPSAIPGVSEGELRRMTSGG